MDLQWQHTLLNSFDAFPRFSHHQASSFPATKVLLSRLNEAYFEQIMAALTPDLSTLYTFTLCFSVPQGLYFYTMTPRVLATWYVRVAWNMDLPAEVSIYEELNNCLSKATQPTKEGRSCRAYDMVVQTARFMLAFLLHTAATLCYI